MSLAAAPLQLRLGGLLVCLSSTDHLSEAQLIKQAADFLASRVQAAASPAPADRGITVNLNINVAAVVPLAADAADAPAVGATDAAATPAASWMDREQAAAKAGLAAATRFLGHKARVAPLGTDLRPRMYLLFRDGAGKVSRPAIRFATWSELARHVEEKPHAIADASSFQGFPSDREAVQFERTFWAKVDAGHA